MISLRILSGLQLVKKVFSFFQTGKEDDIKHRLNDIFADGMVKNSQQFAETREFELIPQGGLYVKIGSGIAYKNGERIIIDADVSAGTVVSEVLDDFSLLASTAGNESILLTDNTTNKLWVRYQRILDSSDYVLHPVSSEQLYYKTLDSYQIANSPSNPDPDYWLKLVSLDVTGGLINVIDYSGRLVLGQEADTVTMIASYGSTVQDHIDAIGHAAVSVYNPHGISVIDIPDWAPYDASIIQSATHSNGIVDTNDDAIAEVAIRTNAFFFEGIPYADSIEFQKLASGEKIFLNGYLIEDMLPHCSETNPNTFWPDLNNTFVPFLSGVDASGTWHIYLESELIEGTPKARISKTQATLTSTQLLLFDVAWDGTIITGYTDHRVYGVTGSKDLQRFKDQSGAIYIVGNVLVSGTVHASNIP